MIDAFLLVGFETRGFTDALARFTHDSPSWNEHQKRGPRSGWVLRKHPCFARSETGCWQGGNGPRSREIDGDSNWTHKWRLWVTQILVILLYGDTFLPFFYIGIIIGQCKDPY